MSKIKKQKKILIRKKANKPFFSIITVVKNAEKDILQTIRSLKEQTFKNFEYLIIDGKSTDDTVKNILTNQKYINLLVSEKDDGIYHAMNKALKFVNGQVIVFINAGDIFVKNGLLTIHKKFKKNPDADFIFGTVRRHYVESTILKYGFNRQRLKYNFDFATSHSTGFFIKKKSMNLIGNYNTTFKCSADYDLYYRALIKFNLKGDSTKRNELIGIFKSGGFSSKISFFTQLFEETKIRLHNKQNIFFVGLIFFNAIIKHFLKTFIK